jgi:hypothetical protein
MAEMAGVTDRTRTGDVFHGPYGSSGAADTFSRTPTGLP